MCVVSLQQDHAALTRGAGVVRRPYGHVSLPHVSTQFMHIDSGSHPVEGALLPGCAARES